MKQICAWCGKELSCNGSPPEDETSYGICLPCANSVIVDIPNDLDEFLDQISIPVILVDVEGKVKTANLQACDLLGKELSEIRGKLGGEIFECVYTLLPGGCGNTYHCSGCVIRRSIMDTFETGKPVYRMPATLKQKRAGKPTEIKFLISTEKFDNCVILRLYGEDVP